MKQTRSLSEYSWPFEFTWLYPIFSNFLDGIEPRVPKQSKKYSLIQAPLAQISIEAGDNFNPLPAEHRYILFRKQWRSR